MFKPKILYFNEHKLIKYNLSKKCTLIKIKVVQFPFLRFIFISDKPGNY